MDAEATGQDDWTQESTEPPIGTPEGAADDGPINAIRFVAWGSSVLSLGAMIGVALNGFCSSGTAAGFIWLYSGLFAFVTLIGLAVATHSQKERKAALIMMGVGTGLGATVGMVSGFASLYPGGC